MECLTVNTRVASPCLGVKVKVQQDITKVVVFPHNALLSVFIKLDEKLIPYIIYQNENIRVKYNVVCSPNLGVEYYFIVDEGLFILSDGKKLKLVKDELS